MNVEVIRSKKPSKKFGNISVLTFTHNKSKIYIYKRGWLLKYKGIEISIPYGEINTAIQESIKRGYVATGD